MKQITVSDEDYEALMRLSADLQKQENDSQAFPYFWSPRSTKWGIGTDDDEKVFYLDDCAETSEEIYDNHCSLSMGLKFLDSENLPMVTEFNDIDLDAWEDFLEEEGYTVHYRREEEVLENNFSLFKSDVKHHVECNAHNLGDKPHTYANTVYRMPKMQMLIECMYRLNPQKEEEINHEARRFVKKQ